MFIIESIISEARYEGNYTMNLKKLLKYSLNAILVYIAVMIYAKLLGTYTVGYEGIAFKDYAYTFVATLLLYVGYQYQKGKELYQKEDFIHALVAIIAMVVTPILYEMTYEEIRFKTIAIYFGYTTGVYFVLTILHTILAKKIPSKSIVTGIMSVLDVLVLVNPFLNLVYFIKFNSLASVSSFMSLYYATVEESVGYIRQQIPVHMLVGIGLGSIVILLLMYLYNVRYEKTIALRKLSKSSWFMGAFSLVLLVSMFNYTYIPRGLRDIHKYAQTLQQYDIKHEQLLNEITFDDENNSMIKQVPGTIIVVIGESANRDYMSVYHPHLKYDSTPWENQMRRENPNFFFFDKGYSSYVQTIVSLERALTENSQYHPKDFLDSVSFIDIAKKLGYDTYWLSNQGLVSRADTSTTLIAKQSKTSRWLELENNNMGNYDEELLTYLKSIPKKGNKLIVLHIMGSHALYEERYPKGAEVFLDEENKVGTTEMYNNTLHYTDSLLKEIYEYGKQNLNLQAMIYFSDHGENLEIGHNPDKFTYDQTHIPFWVYLSPQYERTYPETVQILKKREKIYWTNDMFYDFFIGLLHAKNNKYIEEQDFSSDKYNFTKENLTTFLGKYKIINDPGINN